MAHGPAHLGPVVEILAKAAPAVEHAAGAGDLGRAAQAQDEGTVAVEEPAARIAGEALELAVHPFGPAGMQARRGVSVHRVHLGQVTGRGPPQLEPRGDEGRLCLAHSHCEPV